jgi:hypothetical protein
MKPATNAESRSTFLILLSTHHNFLYGMEALARLYLKEHKLIPAWWHLLAWYCHRLRDPTLVKLSGIQLECATPFLLPQGGVGKWHVKNVRDAPGTNDIVVVEEVAAFSVRVYGHILLSARERTTVSDRTKEGSEVRRIEGIAKSEEGGKNREVSRG